MKTLILALALIFISIPAMAQKKGKESAYERVMRTGTLKCGIMLWPPYFEADANTGKISGMGADLFDAMGKLIDLKIEYTQIIVGQQVEELRSGRIDAVCNDGPYVFSAIKFVDYSDAAYYAPAYVYVSADDDRFHEAGDINNAAYTVLGIDGDITLILAERNFPQAKRVSLPAITDASSLLLSIVTKKADATITDPLLVDGFNAMNKPGLKALSGADPVAVYPIGFSTRKGEQELLNMLNAGIAALWNTNTAEKILRQYSPDGKAFMPIAKPYKESK